MPVLFALDPDNKMVAVLMDSDGKIVTDLSPLPSPVYVADALRVDADGNLEIA